MDINKLTIGEVAAIERLSGQPIDELFADGKPKALAMAAMVFITQKRTNPELTWDQVLELDINELPALFGATEDDQDPK